MLFVIDGGKSLRKAIQMVFGKRALVQRCQIHKMRNVTGHLPKEMHRTTRQAMREAYASKTFKTAKRRLKQLANSLTEDHPGACASLREGLWVASAVIDAQNEVPPPAWAQGNAEKLLPTARPTIRRLINTLTTTRSPRRMMSPLSESEQAMGHSQKLRQAAFCIGDNRMPVVRQDDEPMDLDTKAFRSNRSHIQKGLLHNRPGPQEKHTLADSPGDEVGRVRKDSSCQWHTRPPYRDSGREVACEINLGGGFRGFRISLLGLAVCGFLACKADTSNLSNTANPDASGCIPRCTLSLCGEPDGCEGACPSTDETCEAFACGATGTNSCGTPCTSSICDAGCDHCGSGVQDCDETGLDCGGSDCAACCPPKIQSLFDLFPASPVALRDTELSTLSKTDTLTTGTDWGPDLDESQVFHTSLEHQQDLHNSWELRVGKGSQIYSLRAAFGEAIPPQRSGDAEWVDEVIQAVAVNRDLNNPPLERYFIHQAGSYRRDPAYDVTLYSPLLDEAWDSSRRAYATLVWPQQAHVPTNFRSGLVLAQQLRDIGDGIIEITQVYYNFGNDLIDYVSVPWFPLRDSTLPVQLRSLPDGTAVQDQQLWPNLTGLWNLADTGGWFAFAQGGPADPAVALVVGKDKHLGESFQWATTRLHWGTVQQASRDLMVAEVGARVLIPPESGFFFRYYMIIQPRDSIAALANELVDKVDYGPIQFTEIDTGLFPICTMTTASGQLVFRRGCPDGEAPSFYTYRAPIAGAMPLFHLRDTATNNLVLTNNPYALSDKPYDGTTRYHTFLGWALPSFQTTPACFAYEGLVDLIADPIYFPPTPSWPTSLQALEARTTPESSCSCP